MEYSSVVEKIGGIKISVSDHSGGLNPDAVKEPATITEILSMTHEEKVNWIMRQPVEVQQRFIYWKTVNDLSYTPKNELRELFHELFKFVTNGRLYHVLTELEFV